jgi:hypothetical protein
LAGHGEWRMSTSSVTPAFRKRLLISLILVFGGHLP